MQSLFSPSWKLWHWAGTEDGFDDPPQSYFQAFGDINLKSEETCLHFLQDYWFLDASLKQLISSSHKRGP